MGDAPSADPCQVLDAASLSRFGQTELTPSYRQLNRCDVLVQNAAGDDIADAEVDLSTDVEQLDSGVPVRRVGNVEVASLKRDEDQCLRFIVTPDHRQIVVNGKRESARRTRPVRPGGRRRRPCPRGAGPWPGTPACGALARRLAGPAGRLHTARSGRT
ncbi:hypothetical protein ACQ4WX_47230 [Streptomyces lasalocidi]